MQEANHNREELELLCSRNLDGDISPAERARLESALKADPELRAFEARLRPVHGMVALLSDSFRLPADFRERVLREVEAPVIQLPTRRWTPWIAAAAVLLALGTGITAMVFNETGVPEATPYVAGHNKGDHGAVSPDRTDPVVETPRARVVAVSSGEIEFTDAGGNVTRNHGMDGQLSMPAEVRAPADSHATLQLGKGAVVLQKGARVRLSDVDADGVPDVEPMDGDIYLESWAQTSVRSKVDKVKVSVDRGGLSLRSTPQGYVASPSYGGATVGEMAVGYRQCATIRDNGVSVAACEDPGLEGWVIDGRADAIKLELKNLLGARFEEITTDQWAQWDKLLKGVLSRPDERAKHSYILKLLLKHGFFEEAGEKEIEAFGRIAEILGEGTTEDDIAVNELRMIKEFEKALQEDPEAMAQFKRMLRDMLERMAERQRKPD
ncbi:MAG: hypothetical protein IT464_15545 [Planctomycetes bacterium]|nr:hypothetical protein [Planctomycetota bacterium]